MSDKQTISDEDAAALVRRHQRWSLDSDANVTANLRREPVRPIDPTDKLVVDNVAFGGAFLNGAYLYGAIARECEFNGVSLRGAWLGGDFSGSVFR